MQTAGLGSPGVMLLLLLLLSLSGVHAQGTPGPLHCYGVGPLGSLNCSWEPLGDLGAPTALHLQSQKYRSKRTQVVAVPANQSWATLPRDQLTMDDELLVWGTQMGRPLWPPVVVNLGTQIKPDTPQLFPSVDFSEDEPLEATVQWAPPKWPSHKVLTCQFQYRKKQVAEWTQLEEPLRSSPLSPVEMHDLESDSHYVVSGRCRVETGHAWGEWSPELSFRTPPSAPEDVWVSGHVCETSGPREPLLLWKAPRSCMPMTYRVWFWVGGENRTEERVPCCKSPIPARAERAAVSTVNTTSRVPLTNLSLVCLAPESAPHGVAVRSTAGSPGLLVTWQQGTGEPWGHVVDWVQDGDALENLNWTRLPLGNHSVLLPGDFEGGVPYRIRVTAVFPGGLAPAPSVWGFAEELVPLAGPVVWRLQDDPPGTPAVAWGEVPRHQLRGHVTHYSLCVQSGADPVLCKNVSSSTRTDTLPDLPRGSWELWVRASTVVGQGPPGPSLWLHLTDNSVKWKILPAIVPLWGLLLMGCGLNLATTGRCLHLRHKVLPRWVWEKVPDPANSKSGQPQVEEVIPPQPVQDGPILKVEELEEMEPLPTTEPPGPPAPLHCGYEKHFLPTPEELGLLGTPQPPGPGLSLSSTGVCAPALDESSG